MLDKMTPNALMPAPRGSPHSRRLFYVAMSLLMVGVVSYGFSQTIVPDLLHARRPARTILLLSIHGMVFYGWMLLVVVQAALVRARHIRLHQWLGWFGAADGALVVIMGLWASFHQPAPVALEMLGVVSMAGFAVPVGLAIFWRKRPAYHRRLLLIGTAMLTNAAFARFPGTYLPEHFFYGGTDVMIAIAIVHDVWTETSVHVVYRYALPLLLSAQIAVLIPAWQYLG
jgi:hypothetical protein